MALLEGSLYSEALRMDTAVTVSLPQKMEEAERPVLYLLHGLGDDHTAWVRRSNIDRYANREGIAVIMPEVQRGFYTDMVYGPAYFTYITEELPRLCASLFRVTEDPARTYIAGLSMGGYGALKAALRCPERYAAAGCFSGAVDIRARMKAEDFLMTPGEIQALSGGELAPEDDILMLTARAVNTGRKLPALYLTCGLSDYLYEDNRRLRRQLDFLHIPYVYEEWAGAHEWDFWDRSVRQFLQFIRE